MVGIAVPFLLKKFFLMLFDTLTPNNDKIPTPATGR